MAIVMFLLFGLIVGIIARALMPGDQRMGWIATAILGVLGSVLGGFVTQLAVGGRLDEPLAAGWIGSILGAMLVLAIASKFIGPRLRGV